MEMICSLSMGQILQQVCLHPPNPAPCRSCSFVLTHLPLFPHSLCTCTHPHRKRWPAAEAPLHQGRVYHWPGH